MIQKTFGNAKKVWCSDDILGTGNNTWRSDDNWFSILLEVCIMRGTRVSKFKIKLIIRVVFWCGHQGLNWFRYLQAMFGILAIKPRCSRGSLHAHVSAFFQSLAHLWRLEIAHCSQMKLSHKAQVNNQDSFQNAWVQFKLGCVFKMPGSISSWACKAFIDLRFCYPKGLHKYMGALLKQFAQTSQQ